MRLPDRLQGRSNPRPCCSWTTHPRPLTSAGTGGGGSTVGGGGGCNAGGGGGAGGSEGGGSSGGGGGAAAVRRAGAGHDRRRWGSDRRGLTRPGLSDCRSRGGRRRSRHRQRPSGSPRFRRHLRRLRAGSRRPATTASPGPVSPSRSSARRRSPMPSVCKPSATAASPRSDDRLGGRRGWRRLQ